MKKYTLIIAIGTLLSMPQTRTMEPRRFDTMLSSHEEAQLRKAMIDYKKNRSPQKQELIINWYREIYPNDPLVIAKMNEKTRFDIGSHIKPNFGQSQMQEEKSMQESQIQEEEQQVCCIEADGCTEDQGLGLIPCQNKHSDLICNACLAKIKNSTNRCPICRQQLIE